MSEPTPATAASTASKVSPIPAGRAHAVPHLIVRDGAGAIRFYQQAFGAVETMRIAEPSGKVGHAELRIGEARFMLADEYPEFGCVGPQQPGQSSVVIHVYVEDIDSFAARALEGGAKLLRPIANEFFGERVASLEDPYGHRWTFSSRIEEVSDEEMQRRAAAM